RVIAVDRPGHGLADPFDYRAVDLAEHAVTFLTEILDALELEAVDVVANSIGGWWAAVLALDRPERVKRLVLAGHPPGVTRDAPLPLRILGAPVIGSSLGRFLMRNPTRDGQRKFWGEVLVAYPERLSDVLLDVDVAHTRRNRDSMLGLIRLVVGPRGVRREVLLGERWRQLRVPTVFVHGDRDAFLTQDVVAAWEAIADENAHVRIVRIADAGHLPWIDESEAVVSAIEQHLEAPD
ncbi:MAG TPA: alpha/beta hydrolase, partial [Gaiellaceae bacterium]|nr:alpha/beta hydrolase [Gaiellaceae bacterium]